MTGARTRADSPKPGIKKDNGVPEKEQTADDAPTCPTATIWEKVEVSLASGKKQGNVVRRKTDYYWMISFYIGFYVFSRKTWPDYFCTTLADGDNLALEINSTFGFADPLGKDFWKMWVSYFFFASFNICLVVILCFLFMYAVDAKKAYTSVFWRQVPVIAMNCGLMLPLVDAFSTYLIHKRWFKVFVSEPPYSTDMPVLYHLRDISLWILAFELTWYMQHRAMHDNKFLWKLGHEYHHQWRKPEHMIGITNFAFDHIVEVWVTMSSSYLPMLFFPIHIWAFRLIGFLYMILAVFVHWDLFPMRFHLNHHYCVIKNYGSHVPFFDMFFGTYQWGSFWPAGDDEKYPGFKPDVRDIANERKES